MRLPVASIALGILLCGVFSTADDNRTQYPAWLANSYFDVNVGYINYPFSQTQLEPGYRADRISIPHAGVRVTLLGHNFNKYLSAQVSYTRPVLWIRYTDTNGVFTNRSVWMNVGGLTARGTLPLTNRFSMYAEGGLGIVTRSGFKVDDKDVVKDVSYPAVLVGTGLKYHLNKTWDLQASAVFVPPNNKFRQPYTVMFAGGAVINMRPLSTEQVQTNARPGAIFPRNMIQIGTATNMFGTGVNHFVSGGKVPIFWGGNAEVEVANIARYQRNVFHTKRVFALDVGLSATSLRSIGQRTEFMAFSAFPQFRFMVLRTTPADMYLNYSLAGPTYITKTRINGHDTGRHFTFQDLMGLGCFVGKQRQINLEVGIGHYSNGNLFSRNAGVKIPLTFMAGYTF